jgi:hypothetical protein
MKGSINPNLVIQAVIEHTGIKITTGEIFRAAIGIGAQRSRWSYSNMEIGLHRLGFVMTCERTHFENSQSFHR